MYTSIKRFVLLLLGCFFVVATACGQQVTREQLLKLFYKAHAAQKENNFQETIAAYTEILRLSPRLPDPYLHLGNIYATMTEDAVALKKACICYTTYLELKPETASAENLQKRIAELKQMMEELERSQTSTVTNVVADVIPALDIVKKDSIPHTDAMTTAEKDTIHLPVLKDSVLLVSADLVPAVVDEQLLGRWASAAMGDNGREMWILDIVLSNDEMWMKLNDSSNIKMNPLLADASDITAKGMADGDTLVFTFKVTEKKQTKKKKALLGDFGTIVGEMFDVTWDGLTGASSSAQKAVADTLPDSLTVKEPLIEYSYVFRLKYDGYKLSGTLQNKVVDEGQNGNELLNNKQVCELFRTPATYSGFGYLPISEEVKSTQKDLRTLLNQKMQESATVTSALNDLGCMYASGIGIRRNMKMAVAYFMEASMKNNLFGKLNMARLYLEGLGVEKEPEKARALLQSAYESGYTDAMVLCGDSYLEGTADMGPDYKNALVCYQKAVIRRSPFASYRLGWLYREGLGVTQDLQKSWEYYQKALEMQYPDAMVDAGVFYRDGILVEQDYAKAYEWLMKAADKGNARAMYELSQMYLKGQGVKPDFKHSKDWLLRSMEAGDSVIEGYCTVKSAVNSILHPKQ